jgi:hypothetical protein
MTGNVMVYMSKGLLKQLRERRAKEGVSISFQVRKALEIAYGIKEEKHAKA